MFDEIIACLDGSPLAEKILPLARGMARQGKRRLIFLRIVEDNDELAAEEEYLRNLTREYGAELRFRVSPDPAGAIIAELDRQPRAIAALTTHGRTAWGEAILGSVALGVLRGAKRPVIIFRSYNNPREAPKRISTIALALDGTHFAECMISYAVRAAQALSAGLLLIQALPSHADLADVAVHEKSDIVEASYLHCKAAEIKATYGIEAQWEVLHGAAPDAICRYLSDAPETLIAMTTHARAKLERLVLGSIAGACVRHAGVPLLLYWPPR